MLGGRYLKDAFKAMADPTRREILMLLKEGEMTVSEIADHFDVSMASISQHLKILTNANLVRFRKDGKYIYYQLHASIVEDLIHWLIKLSN
jgi:DNA-binding transcriptional ArsR family regulator